MSPLSMYKLFRTVSGWEASGRLKRERERHSFTGVNHKKGSGWFRERLGQCVTGHSLNLRISSSLTFSASVFIPLRGTHVNIEFHHFEVFLFLSHSPTVSLMNLSSSIFLTLSVWNRSFPLSQGPAFFLTNQGQGWRKKKVISLLNIHLFTISTCQSTFNQLISVCITHFQ